MNRNSSTAEAWVNLMPTVQIRFQINFCKIKYRTIHVFARHLTKTWQRNCIQRFHLIIRFPIQILHHPHRTFSNRYVHRNRLHLRNWMKVITPIIKDGDSPKRSLKSKRNSLQRKNGADLKQEKQTVRLDRKTIGVHKDSMESDDDVDDEQLISDPKKRCVVPDRNRIAPDDDNDIDEKEDEQDALNPYGQIVLVMPDKGENPSSVWLAELHRLFFQDGKRVTNWNRYLWCGHNWNCLSSSGNSNMRMHVSGHFNGSITLTRKQLAEALAVATEYGVRYGKFPAETFERLYPVKHKKEKGFKF